MMLKTCSSTETPPKPSKKAHNTILIDMFFEATEVISDTPFVSSIIPEMIGLAKEKSILRNFKIGYEINDIISNILLLLNIEITTEKITTKPPIIIIVLLESIMASERIPPKFLTLQSWILSVWIEVVKELWLALFLCFENTPNMMPTEIADNIWVINNKIPILEFENILIPNSS